MACTEADEGAALRNLSRVAQSRITANVLAVRKVDRASQNGEHCTSPSIASNKRTLVGWRDHA